MEVEGQCFHPAGAITGETGSLGGLLGESGPKEGHFGHKYVIGLAP